MLSYLNTVMAMTYNTQQKPYVQALIQKELEVINVGQQGLLALNRGNADVPRAYLPQVIAQDHPMNTLNKTVVMVDTAKINAKETDFRHTLGVLTTAWESGDTVFDQTRRFLTKTYIAWVGQSLTRRFGLPYDDAFALKVYLAIYFYCSHSTPMKVLSNPASFAAISEITGFGAGYVNDIIEDHQLREYDNTLTLKETIDMAKSISPEVKSKLDLNSVIATVSRSWVGETGTFYCNLAVEYPPAFATLLYYALVDRGFRKTGLSTSVEQYSSGRNKDLGVNYTKALNQLITTLLKVG